MYQKYVQMTIYNIDKIKKYVKMHKKIYKNLLKLTYQRK